MAPANALTGHDTQLADSLCKRYAVTFAPAVCRQIGFRVYFTSLSGNFSPFPHGTGSLSVVAEYLALEGGPPMFPRGFTCLRVLWILLGQVWISNTGVSPSTPHLPRCFFYPFLYHAAVQTPYQLPNMVWAGPRSLAATRGVSIDFFSFRYLDVSVP